MTRVALVTLGLAAAACAGCASGPPPRERPAIGRTRAEVEAGMEREKARTPFLPMLSEEKAHEAMPGWFQGRPMPTLMRVAALQPKMMEAVIGSARAMRTEGGLDSQFLNDVFWAVSSANDCFY